jgi:hypothetical protein
MYVLECVVHSSMYVLECVVHSSTQWYTRLAIPCMDQLRESQHARAAVQLLRCQCTSGDQPWVPTSQLVGMQLDVVKVGEAAPFSR